MKTITIGRDISSTVVVDQAHGRVSNDHADIEVQDGQLIFTDHSTNGTLINGRLIHHSSIAVRNGDIILLADSYVLPWSVIFEHFPEMQRKTEMFDPSQIDMSLGERRTEMFDSSQINNNTQDRRTETMGHSFQGNDSLNGSSTSETSTVGQLNDFTQAEIDETLEKFNFGAFLSSWVWAAAKGMYWPLLIIPISLIPFVGQICSLFLCTYLGIVGYKKAWQSFKGDSFSEFIAKQRKWVVWGPLLFILFAFIQFVSLYYLLIEI